MKKMHIIFMLLLFLIAIPFLADQAEISETISVPEAQVIETLDIESSQISMDIKIFSLDSSVLTPDQSTGSDTYNTTMVKSFRANGNTELDRHYVRRTLSFNTQFG